MSMFNVITVAASENISQRDKLF